MFLDELYPILRDLTHSIRQGDWHLFVSAVRRCMPLFFEFGRTNYCRWGMQFLEDCLDIQRSSRVSTDALMMEDGGCSTLSDKAV